MPFLNDDTMHSQEELAALLDRNLTLNPAPPPPPAPAPITYSVSQHYHHSAHIAKAQAPAPPASAPPPASGLDVGHHPVQRPASEPPQPEHQGTGAVLARHGVDASMLSAAQLELFKTADEPQKAYLVQLWRLSPPTNSRDNPTLAWASTTVEQEEALVRLRLQAEETGVTGFGGGGDGAMSLDGTPVPTPMQGGDGRWLYATSYMEPYMEAGYGAEEQLLQEQLQHQMQQQRLVQQAEQQRQQYQQQQLQALHQQEQQLQQQRQATDPAYRTTNAGVLPDWAVRQQETMENNYGMLMAMRENMEL